MQYALLFSTYLTLATENFRNFANFFFGIDAMRNLILRRFSTLTKDRYPNIKRHNFAALQDNDVKYFENILDKNQIITNEDEVQPFNSDWLKSVRGKYQLSCALKQT